MFATGSRAGDISVFLALLALLVAETPRLKVYYTVDVMTLELALVEPDGSISSRPVPEPLQHPGHRLDRLTERIRAFMASARLPQAPEGGCYRWTIRYARDATRPDRTRTLRFPEEAPCG